MKKKVIIVVLFLVGIIFTVSAAYLYVKIPELTMPKYVTSEYDFEKREYQERKVYVLSSKNKKTDQVILYIHGGAYATNLDSNYWNFLSDLAKDTGATIVIPDYPLAPEYGHQDVFDFMIPFYEEVLEKVKKENLIVMGDSAGGGLSLALCQHEGEKGNMQPSKLILISPWLDITMKNEAIDGVQPYDPKLKKDLLKLAAKVYIRDEDMDHYLASPINGPVEHLENVTIFSGNYDILNPDARLFTKMAENKGIHIDYRETSQATHIWILFHRDKETYHAEESYQELIKLVQDN